jgi:hypothetical protein
MIKLTLNKHGLLLIETAENDIKIIDLLYLGGI